MKKLPQIPQDKANHFLVGFVIFLLSSLFLNNFISLAVVSVIALGKEIYDEYDYGGFDWIDFLFTIASGVMLTGISL